MVKKPLLGTRRTRLVRDRAELGLHLVDNNSKVVDLTAVDNSRDKVVDSKAIISNSNREVEEDMVDMQVQQGLVLPLGKAVVDTTIHPLKERTVPHNHTTRMLPPKVPTTNTRRITR